MIVSSSRLPSRRYVFVGHGGDGLLFVDDDYRDTGTPLAAARGGYLIAGGRKHHLESCMQAADRNTAILPSPSLIAAFMRASRAIVDSQP